MNIHADRGGEGFSEVLGAESNKADWEQPLRGFIPPETKPPPWFLKVVRRSKLQPLRRQLYCGIWGINRWRCDETTVFLCQRVCVCVYIVKSVTVSWANFLTRSNPRHPCEEQLNSTVTTWIFLSLSVSSHTHTHTPVTLFLITETSVQKNGFQALWIWKWGKDLGGLWCWERVIVWEKKCRSGGSDKTDNVLPPSPPHSAVRAPLALPSVPVINPSGPEPYGLWLQLCGACCHTQRRAVTLICTSIHTVRVPAGDG